MSNRFNIQKNISYWNCYIWIYEWHSTQNIEHVLIFTFRYYLIMHYMEGLLHKNSAEY